MKTSRRYFSSFKRKSCLPREIAARRFEDTTKPQNCCGFLFKAYGASMDAQRCSNTLKQVLTFGKESKTTILTTKYQIRLSFFAMFYSKVFASSEFDFAYNNCCLFFTFCAIAFSVLDMGVIY